MRGEFIGVWPQMWPEIWVKLGRSRNVPPDLFPELYRELSRALTQVPSAQVLAEIVDDPFRARVAFRKIRAGGLKNEQALVDFLEATHGALEDLGGDALTNRYFNLLSGFIERFSLRYDLRRPCSLCPTLPGVFASLMRELRALTEQDAHLDRLRKEFEDAVRDLRGEQSDGRIKTCLQKQVNLLEAIGQRSPGVTQNTLGRICGQINSWPHDKLREAMVNMYHFTCDYPGIRHGGTPGNARRLIDMRDMVAVAVLLAGFTPYLLDQLDPASVYGRN
jgi:hypothetical protein